MIARLRLYLDLLKSTLEYCWGQKALAVSFLVVSTLAALSEGVSLAMLIPMFQLDAPEPALYKTPWIGPLLSPFAGMPKHSLISWTVGLMAGVLVLRGALQFWNGLLSSTLPIKLKLQLSQRVYASLVNSSVPFVEGQDIGTLSSYVEDHPARVASAVRSLLEVIFSAGLIAVYGLLMLAISWEMTILAGVIVLLLGMIAKVLLINPLDQISVGLSTAQARLHNVFFNTIHALRLIHLVGAEKRMQASFNEAAVDYYRNDRHRVIVASGQSPIMMTGAGLFVCAVVVVFAQLAPNGDTGWIATVLVFMLAFYRMLTPAVAINNSLAVIQGNFHSFDVLRRFIAASHKCQLVSGDDQWLGLESRIAFDDVIFSYPGSPDVVLDHLSFEIPRNRMVALVGPSGAGKSSIISLLVRYHEPIAGRILLDGRDLNSFEIRSWRRRVGVVSQQSILLNDSVRNNVCFGLDGVSSDELQNALKLAAADEFVNALPQGVETILGEKGARLSGGQQQRLSIARAFLQDPDLLILDEATSHLDSLTEQAIQQALALLRGKKTIIVIAHRLATIQSADTIFVLDRGQVVEQGTHSLLNEKSGLYRRMLDQQIIDPAPLAGRFQA